MFETGLTYRVDGIGWKSMHLRGVFSIAHLNQVLSVHCMHYMSRTAVDVSLDLKKKKSE